MRDPTALRALSSPRLAVRVATAQARTVFRLKSWQQGNERLVLYGRGLVAQVGQTSGGPVRVQCIGPGDWMIISHELPSRELRARIEADSTGGLALVDLSDAFVWFEVAGRAARAVLSKGCGLDFHPLAFPVGRCSRTRLAQIPVVAECLDDSPCFELSVPRSYGHYLHSWLMDAAIEFRDH